jgi:RHS repeat-associated protein
MRTPLILAVLVLALLPAPAAAQDVIEYYGVDAVGSVRVVFDSAGNLINRMDYGPFGEQLAGSGYSRRIYAQLFRDGETGQDYAQARMYQARTARFGAPDPVYGSPSNPQAWNRYSYALNSPLLFTDATGLLASQCDSQIKAPNSESGHFKVNTKCNGGSSSGGGGGGGGGTIDWDFYSFLFARSAFEQRGASSGDTPQRGSGRIGTIIRDVVDALTGSETTGSAVPGEDELVPTPRIESSKSVAVTTLTAVLALSFAKRLPAIFAKGSTKGVAAQSETLVYRVFGGEARGMGHSFTTVEPWTVPNYRGAAGLPTGNSGSFLLEGVLTDRTGVVFRPSLPGAGGPGGLAEVLIPNPNSQVRIIRVSGLNPPW